VSRSQVLKLNCGKCLMDICMNDRSHLTCAFPYPFQNHLPSDDIKRRRKCYASDWTDGFKKKGQVIPAVLFLYFACLSPTVSFGTIANQITNGNIGIVEFLLSSGLSGMVRMKYSFVISQGAVHLAYIHTQTLTNTNRNMHPHFTLHNRRMLSCLVNLWPS
jgi:HCO3- transporter family